MPHADGQNLVGLDALVGGFVVVDEQARVAQEAPGGPSPVKPAGGRSSVAQAVLHWSSVVAPAGFEPALPP